MRLDEIREIARIEADREDGYRHRINVCVAAGCLSCQSASVKDAFEKEIAKRGLENWCRVKGVGCLGLCSGGPLVAIEPAGILYHGVSVSDVSDVWVSGVLIVRPCPRPSLPSKSNL